MFGYIISNIIFALYINNISNMISEIINNILTKTVDSFDFGFCVGVNVLTYVVIKIITDVKKNHKINTWYKRLIFIITSLVTAVCYYIFGHDMTTIFNSIIIAPISWSWIFKPICDKLNIDYKNVNNVKVKD